MTPDVTMEIFGEGFMLVVLMVSVLVPVATMALAPMTCVLL